MVFIMELLSIVDNITSIIASLLSLRKSQKEISEDKHNKHDEIHHNRPEFDIVEYKNYLARTHYGTKKPCDIELFVAHIQSVSIRGEKKSPIVDACYNDTHFDPNEWCCVIYTLKNTGKTDIKRLDINCIYKRDTCLFPVGEAKWYSENHILNYSECYDKKVRVGSSITLKFCYHKDAIIAGPYSAMFHIGIVDDDGRYWVQPLFAPENKIYPSKSISAKEYADEMDVRVAERCFANPALW